MVKWHKEEERACSRLRVEKRKKKNIGQKTRTTTEQTGGGEPWKDPVIIGHDCSEESRTEVCRTGREIIRAGLMMEEAAGIRSYVPPNFVLLTNPPLLITPDDGIVVS